MGRYLCQTLYLLPVYFLGICLIIIVCKQFCFLCFSFDILSEACLGQLTRIHNHHFQYDCASSPRLVCIHNTKEPNVKFLCHHVKSFTVEIMHTSGRSPEPEAALFSRQVQWYLCMSLSFGYPRCLSPDSHWDSLPAYPSGFGDDCEQWAGLLDLASS